MMNTVADFQADEPEQPLSPQHPSALQGTPRFAAGAGASAEAPPADAQASISALLIESSRDGILAFDHQCRYTVWNPAMERISGLSREEVVGRSAFEVFPFLEEMGEARFLYGALQGLSLESHDQRYVIPSTGKEGFFEGQYSPLRDAEGNIIGGLAVIHDVTERKQAEQQARNEADTAERRFRTAFEQAPLSMQVIAPSGRTLRVNRAWEKLWGLTLDDLAGYNLLADQQLIDQGLMPFIRKGFGGEATDIPAICYNARDSLNTGFARWVSGYIYPLKNDEGEVTEVVIIHEDISDQKAIEDLQLRQTRQQALRADASAAFQPATPLRQSLQLCAEAVAQHLDVALAQVWTLQPGHPQPAQLQSGQPLLELQASAGYADGPYDSAACSASDESTIGAIAQDRQPCHSNDILADPCFCEKEWAQQAQMVSFAGYPIQVQGQVAGVLALYSRQPLPDDVPHALWSVVDAVAQGIQGHRAEASLKESEQRYRSLFEMNPAPTWVIHAETLQFLTVNRAAVEHYGYSREEFAARTLADVEVSGVEGAEVASSIAPEAAVRPFRKHRLRDGSVIDVEMEIQELEYEGHRAFIVIVNDVSAKRKAEEGRSFLAETGAVLGSSLNYDTTLESIARLLVPFLADWCIIDVVEGEAIRRVAVNAHDPAKQSAIAELQLRYPPTPDSPQPAMQALREARTVHFKSVDFESLSRVVRDQEHMEIMQRLAARSALAIPLMVRGRAVGAITLAMAESGRSYGNSDVALAEEVAHRAAMAIENASLYHEVKKGSQMKDEFLAILSHELRTPLTAILGWSNMLRLGRVDADTSQMALASIERNARMQAQMVEDLLEVSRIVTGKFYVDLKEKECDLNFVVETALETVQSSAEEKHIDLKASYPNSACRVQGDQHRLHQVALNLLSNAIKFTPAGGRVNVELQSVGPLFELRVSDTGKGIADDLLPHIFDRFRQGDSTSTRQFGGLGLGLSIVKQIVEAHNGSIEAQSPGEGKGAVFTVRLPHIPHAEP